MGNQQAQRFCEKMSAAWDAGVFCHPLHEHQRQENRPWLICTLIRNTQARTRGCQEAPGERCERMSHPALAFGGGRADGWSEWRDAKEMQSWGEYNGVSFRYDLIAPCSHHATFMVMRSAWHNWSLRACCSKCINVYTCTSGKTLKPLVYQKNYYTSTNMYIFREWVWNRCTNILTNNFCLIVKMDCKLRKNVQHTYAKKHTLRLKMKIFIQIFRSLKSVMFTDSH